VGCTTLQATPPPSAVERRNQPGETQKVTPKEIKKQARFDELKDAVEEFIASHELSNHHHLRDDEIIAAFSYAKPKHVKRAIKEVR
jgi:hypothetical protein